MSEEDIVSKTPSQCRGQAKSTGNQCRWHVSPTWTKPLPFCKWHYPCQGHRRDGSPCRAFARHPGSEFCRPDHDPRDLSIYSDPLIFRMDDCRFHMQHLVLEERSRVDAYTQKSVVVQDQDTVQLIDGLELDHVLEIQVLRDAYDNVIQTWKPRRTQAQALVQESREAINVSGNLNFTSVAINTLKCEAVQEYLHQYKSQPIGDRSTNNLHGIHEFLLKSRETKKLSRATTRRLTHEIIRSYDHVLDHLPAERPGHEFLRSELHDLVLVGMKLV